MQDSACVCEALGEGQGGRNDRQVWTTSSVFSPMVRRASLASSRKLCRFAYCVNVCDCACVFVANPQPPPLPLMAEILYLKTYFLLPS